MTPVGTLWCTVRQPLGKIVLSVAALNELELEQPEWTFPAKPAAFTSKFPYGKIPAFEAADGFTLIEGVTIARYLCGLGTKVNLLGTDAKASILVDQWIHFAEHEIGGPAHNINGLLFGFAGPFSRESLDKYVERLCQAMQHVEAHLATRPSGYLVSDGLTLADLVLAGMTYGAAFAALGAEERAKFPHVYAHFARVAENEKVERFWGTDGFAEVAVRAPKSRPTA